MATEYGSAPRAGAYLAATELDLAAVAVVYGGWSPTTEIPLGGPEPTLTRTPKITAGC
jgi:carboxymethylenebutenolidase